MTKKISTRIYYTFLIITITAAAALFTILCIHSISDTHARAVPPDTLTRLSFRGTYAIDGGKPQDLADGIGKTGLSGYHTIVFTGHFTTSIPKGMRMAVKLKYLTISFSIKNSDGTTSGFFSYGDTTTRPPFRGTGGFLYQQFQSPGITPLTPVIITVSNTKTLDIRASYREFLGNMYAGSIHELFLHELRRFWVYPLSGFFLIMLGINLLMFIVFTQLRTREDTHTIIILALITIFGGIWHTFIYELFTLIVPYPALADVIAYTAYYTLAALLPLFFAQWLRTKLRFVAFGCFWAACAGFIITLLLQAAGITDMFGGPSRPYMFFYSLTLPGMILLLAYEACWCSNKDAGYVALSTLPFIVSICLSAALSFFLPFSSNYFLELIGSAYFCVSEILFIFRRINAGISETIRLQAEENRITENRRKIMLSKIQPHFLYNALTTIKGLAMTDPEKACEAIDDFSFFLRGNMDSLAANGLIPFEKELEHTKQYLALEKMRFGTRLNIMYDIRTSDFSLPPLTLQPIVENAVRYGVTKKPGGGTVIISTKTVKGSIIITVTDDGAGFDPMEKKDDGRTHVGIDNVRERIRLQCRGDLIIMSRSGIGTVAVITIPEHVL